MKIDRRERRLTALHEAGHAVVATALYMRVRKVTIRPHITHNACEVHHACVHIDWIDGVTTFRRRTRTFRGAVEDLAVCFAGEYAQGDAGGAGDDREDARKIAWGYSFGDERAARALEAYARAVARALVKKHRRSIGRVARALLAKETLTGAQVRRLVRRRS